MNLKSGLIGLLVIAVGILISACSNRQIPVQSIYSSSHCPINRAMLKTVNSQLELSQLFDFAPANFGPKPSDNIEVDFDQQILIVFALGQKPTAGYSLQLIRKQATVKGQKLYLPIRIMEPDQNLIQAQVVTSPCQVYSLPRADYSEIFLEQN